MGTTPLWVVSAVRSGRGGELKRSLWGYKISAYGVLATTIGMLIILIAVAVVAWWRRRADDKLVLKYRQAVEKSRGDGDQAG